jgi:hypothetical protein
MLQQQQQHQHQHSGPKHASNSHSSTVSEFDTRVQTELKQHQQQHRQKISALERTFESYERHVNFELSQLTRTLAATEVEVKQQRSVMEQTDVHRYETMTNKMTEDVADLRRGVVDVAKAHADMRSEVIGRLDGVDTAVDSLQRRVDREHDESEDVVKKEMVILTTQIKELSHQISADDHKRENEMVAFADNVATNVAKSDLTIHKLNKDVQKVSTDMEQLSEKLRICDASVASLGTASLTDTKAMAKLNRQFARLKSDSMRIQEANVTSEDGIANE